LGALGSLKRHELNSAVVDDQTREQHKTALDDMQQGISSLKVADQVTKEPQGIKPQEEEKPVGELLPSESSLPSGRAEPEKLEQRINEKLEKVEELKKPDTLAEKMHELREEEERQKEERKEHRKEKSRELRDKLKGPLPPKTGEMLSEHSLEMERKRDEEYERLVKIEEEHERIGDIRNTDEELMSINGHPPEFQQRVGRQQDEHGQPGSSVKFDPVLSHPEVKRADIHEDRIMVPTDVSDKEHVRESGMESSTAPATEEVKVESHEREKQEQMSDMHLSKQEQKQLRKLDNQ